MEFEDEEIDPMERKMERKYGKFWDEFFKESADKIVLEKPVKKGKKRITKKRTRKHHLGRKRLLMSIENRRVSKMRIPLFNFQ